MRASSHTTDSLARPVTAPTPIRASLSCRRRATAAIPPIASTARARARPVIAATKRSTARWTTTSTTPPCPTHPSARPVVRPVTPESRSMPAAARPASTVTRTPRPSTTARPPPRGSRNASPAMDRNPNTARVSPAPIVTRALNTRATRRGRRRPCASNATAARPSVPPGATTATRPPSTTLNMGSGAAAHATAEDARSMRARSLAPSATRTSTRVTTQGECARPHATARVVMPSNATGASWRAPRATGAEPCTTPLPSTCPPTAGRSATAAIRSPPRPARQAFRPAASVTTPPSTALRTLWLPARAATLRRSCMQAPSSADCVTTLRAQGTTGWGRWAGGCVQSVMSTPRSMPRPQRQERHSPAAHATKVQCTGWSGYRRRTAA